MDRGVHPPEVIMHFPPVSDFPLFSKKNSDSVENFQNFTFSRKISRFSSAKISDDLFFSRRPQILNFPLFFLFQYIFPCFVKIIFPLLFKISPCFRKIHLLFKYFMCISFPPLLWPWCIYASPNARTGCPGTGHSETYSSVNWIISNCVWFLLLL